MPKNRKSRSTTQLARRRAGGGKQQKIDGRQNGGHPQKGGPDFLANSISALRLATIPGAKALAAKSKVGGFQLLINDVSRCVRKLYPNQSLKAPNGLADYEVFAWWQEKLREAIPDKADYKFNGDDKGFWIDVFREEEWVGWNMFRLYCEDILLHLQQNDPAGYDIFIRFLNQLAHTIKCDTWASGLFAESLDQLNEMVECEPETIGEKNLEKARHEILFFTKGEGHELTRKVHRLAQPGIECLLIESSDVKDPFIRELIRLGCELMEPGYAMTDFVDVVGHEDDYYGEMGLRFDSQACLFYNCEHDYSPATYEYDQRIEMYCHEGGFVPPFNQITIRPADRKLPDFEEFEKRRQWLKQLNQFFDSWISVARFYYDEQTKQPIEITV